MSIEMGQKHDEQKHVFGPVPSRRLGLSLGVDLVPYKTCTYNCVYCQLGPEPETTIKRESFWDPGRVVDEVKAVLESGTEIDYITFSGSGDPTLSSDLGFVIKEIKKLGKDVPIAVLTNGSLLWDPGVRQELAKADVVVPSIDAVSDEVWHKINRPCAELKIGPVLDGIKSFCNQYPDKVMIEIMIVKGVNDSEDELGRFREFLKGIAARKIQLNTVVRPPAEPSATPVEEEYLKNIARQITTSIPVEIIADYTRSPGKHRRGGTESAVLELLARRPCGLEEMASSLGADPTDISEAIDLLKQQNKITETAAPGNTGVFYSLTRE